MKGLPSTTKMRKAVGKRKFTAWLYEQPDKRVLAPSDYTCNSCPIALYLTETLGPLPDSWDYVVGVDEIGIENKEGDLFPVRMSTPAWAFAFISAVDEWSGMRMNKSVKRITAKRARQLCDL